MIGRRPDGITLRRPTETKKESFFILELKRMSGVTDNTNIYYLERSKQKVESQYDSLRTDLTKTLQPHLKGGKSNRSVS